MTEKRYIITEDLLNYWHINIEGFIGDGLSEIPLAPDCDECPEKIARLQIAKSTANAVLEPLKAEITKKISEYKATNEDLKVKILKAKTPQSEFVFSDILDHNRIAIDVLHWLLDKMQTPEDRGD